jgi:hypothetical protein
VPGSAVLFRKPINMKKLIILLFAALALFNTSCLPDKCCEPPQSNFYLSAQKDGTPWNAYPVGYAIKNDTITITGTGVNAGPQLDSLAIRLKYTGPGNYKLLKNQGYYYYYVGHSGPVMLYNLDSLYDNNLNIINYDQTRNIISGTFNLKFAGTNNTTDASFLDGKFYIGLHN